METLDQIEMEQNQPGISPLAARNMRATAPWMIFVGVMFLISGAMMVLTGISIFFGSDQYKSIGMENMFLLMGAFYLISGLMFVGCGILLVSGGSKLSTFAKFPTHLGLESFTGKQCFLDNKYPNVYWRNSHGWAYGLVDGQLVVIPYPIWGRFFCFLSMCFASHGSCIPL